MPRSRIFTWLFIGLIAVIVVTCLAIDILLEAHLGNYAKVDATRRLDTAFMLMPQIIVDFSQKEDLDQLRLLLHNMGTRSGLRITLLDSAGKPVADSRLEENNFDNQPEQREIKAFLQGRNEYIIRYSPTPGEDVMYGLAEIGGTESPFAIIRIGAGLGGFKRRIGSIRLGMMAAAALLFLIFLVPLYIFSRSLLGPVRDIIGQSKRFALSKIAEPLDLDRDDEIGELSRTLDNTFQEITDTLGRVLSERQYLSSVLGALVEGVVVINTLERVVYINRTAAELLETEQEISAERPVWEIARHPELNTAILDALHTKVHEPREIRLVEPEGDRFVKVYSSAVQSDDAEVEGAVVVFQDVTEMRHLAESRHHLVSNVSHEFKTPLTAISGITETLLDHPEMPPDQRSRFLGRIAEQCRRLNSLARDVLELSRAEFRDIDLPPEPHDICPVLRASFDAFIDTAGRKGLHMEFHDSKTPLMVRADEQSIRQVADNLIDNAVKYTPENGTVSVQARQHNGYALIEVIDTGYGIEPKDRERIFDRFYRTEHARQPETEGTGLGLAIVKAIVDSHEGKIEVDTRLGEGSVFRIYFLLYRPNEADNDPPNRSAD